MSAALDVITRAVAAAFPADRVEPMLDAIERAFRMSGAPKDASPACVLCGGHGVPRFPLIAPPQPLGLHIGAAVPFPGMRASAQLPGVGLACLDCLALAREEHSANPPSASADRLLRDALRAVRASGTEQAEATALALETAFARAGGPVLSRELHPGCFLCGETRPSAQGAAKGALCEECANDHWRLIATDGLTGACTRSVFAARLDQAISRVRRLGEPLALLMLDVDWMKSWNDIYGHLAGDTLLTRVPGIMKGAMRAGDVVARFGGEEFASILPGRIVSEAVAIGEAIRARAYESLRPPEIAHDATELLRTGMSGRPHFPEGNVTVSIGIAGLDPDANLMDLLRAAEERVHDAKSLGRNRVAA